jgi:hypothetical protein
MLSRAGPAKSRWAIMGSFPTKFGSISTLSTIAA